MRTRFSGSRAKLLVAFAVALAVGVGFLAGALSLIGVLLLWVMGVIVVSLLLLRRSLRAASPSGSAALAGGVDVPTPSEGATSDRELRFSRGLFYLGTLGVAEANFRVALGFTVSELFFFAALAGAAFAALRGKPVSRLPISLVVGVGLFAFGGTISSFAALSPAASFTEVIHGVYVMLLWGWTAAMVLRTRRQTMIAITLWAVSAAIDGAGALAQVVGVHALVGPLEGSRATAFTPHPNDLGGAEAIALVPCLLLTARAASARSPLGRLLPWGLLILTAAGLMLSASVTAMVVALAGIVIWLSLPSVRTPSRVAVLAGLAAALLALVVAGGGITSPVTRIQQVTSPAGTSTSAGSGDIRISEVKTAWPRIEANPLVGTGLDISDTVVTILTGGQVQSYQTHGAPLAVWYGAGIFGLIGLLVIFASLLRTGWRSLGLARLEEDVLIGWALVAALVAFIIFAMAVPFAFQQYAWFSAAMLVAWCSRRRAEAAERDAVMPAPEGPSGLWRQAPA